MAGTEELMHSDKRDIVVQQGPVQIVEINGEGTGFVLLEGKLHKILTKIDPEMKVAIVSVVGAFRTGKSFVLDLFLRYLRFSSQGGVCSEGSHEWILSGANGMKQSKLEGNSNIGQEGGNDGGFSWRAGPERNTTGIWMWGEPFIRKLPTGENVAVLLVDTQGMFDSETTQMLTASIFGLSTLLSSYQIYNVTRQVQEDNLQHLALFSEYGRMALKSGVVEDVGTGSAPKDVKVERPLSKEMSLPNDDSDLENIESLPCPFQWLEFLVRDWQNFDDDHSVEEKIVDMDSYRDTVLSQKRQQDLANTREQIYSCFEKLTCWLLPHPGKEVTKPKYDGSVEKIDNEFLDLLSAYVEKIFGERLCPKTIHGKPVTAMELFEFIRVYVDLFTKATLFPEAKTLLEATAEANNVNSKAKALLKYKAEMNKVAGVKSGYVKPAVLKGHATECKQAAVQLFDTSANMGRRSQILEFRKLLIAEIDDEFARYETVNNERDPWKNIEIYVIPGLIAFILVVTRFVGDLFCYEELGYDLPVYDCKHVSHGLSHVYWAIFTFMIIMALATGQVMIDRVKLLVTLIKGQSNSSNS